MKTEAQKAAGRRLAAARAEKDKLANRLRSRPTRSEIQMRKLLRELGFRFCFQHAIGGYVGDYVFIDRKLIVEVDGSSHEGREAYDTRRDFHLRDGYGYRTLRIKDYRIREEPDVVLGEIKDAFWTADKCFDTRRFQGKPVDCATPGTVKKRKKSKKRKRRVGLSREAMQREDEDLINRIANAIGRD